MNSHQVALGESTCTAIYSGTSTQQLNIVDLGQLCLERSVSARECIVTMGALAEKHGYYDAGESLFVTDPNEAWVFHVLPDSTGDGAVFVAQLIDPSHVSTVMNAFIVRQVDVASPAFITSSNLLPEATKLGWVPTEPLDFASLFSGGDEQACKYSSGLRMWAVYNTLSSELGLESTYSSYLDAGYPVSGPPDELVNATQLRSLMRNTYEGTVYSLAEQDGFGPFSSASRWSTPQLVDNSTVCWPRSISTFKSIVSFVAESRSWLPNEIGGLVHFTPHSARGGVMVPFTPSMKSLPIGYTSNSLGDLCRGTSAFWAARYVYNLVEMKTIYAIEDVRAFQSSFEDGVLQNLTRYVDEAFVEGTLALLEVQSLYNGGAVDAVAALWELSDRLVMMYADGYCNGCGKGPKHLGYPQAWLDDVYGN